MEAYRIIEVQSTPTEATCPFCDTDICPECGGCHGDCPPYHRCGCCEIRDDRGRVVEFFPSKRCAGCYEHVPIVFLSGGVCPDCR